MELSKYRVLFESGGSVIVEAKSADEAAIIACNSGNEHGVGDCWGEVISVTEVKWEE